MSRYWGDEVASLSPYVAGEQSKAEGLLKLNTNENPYGPSPRVIEAIGQAAGPNLRLYPDNTSKALRQAVGQLYDIDPDCVFAGNGSDEVLAHVFKALFRRQGRPLLLPDITYSFYRTYCQLYDIPVQLVPLSDDFAIVPDDYAGPHRQPPAGIIFSNPNAPTGRVLALAEIAGIAAANADIPVVVDEAYVDFGAESAVTLLEQRPNLVVVQTLSKSRSLAGMRVGLAISSPTIIEGLNRVKDSFNSYPLDTLAQAAAVAALEDPSYFDETRQAIMRERDDLTQQLAALGFEVLPSMANFVFARHPQHDGGELARALRAQNVLVRHFNLPRIDQFLRITVGTPDDSRRLCSVLKRIMG
ncbi:histidinol-phosphate transaminase [Allopusillimonas soli]|uniref:Histidinol-phosphate aminotransferase n=1 Tax=Allopusillimonas soli TaxID=659016 RepID=A0A853FEP6_9BURK|nr:histidinol-phosphate transaminase [Allopusillimonas soli]NYT36981.1 histidinol-phosphate transaminase [Allopusillimonas soli]TEA75429.1 histidinol-phosphate transaminase [Allopusillimonas soli]